MARLILPLDLAARQELEQLSRESGLAVGVLLDLWRRGFKLVRVEESPPPRIRGVAQNRV